MNAPCHAVTCKVRAKTAPSSTSPVKRVFMRVKLVRKSRMLECYEFFEIVHDQHDEKCIGYGVTLTS